MKNVKHYQFVKYNLDILPSLEKEDDCFFFVFLWLVLNVVINHFDKVEK